MYCKHCGEKLTKDSKFCKSCGKSCVESKFVRNVNDEAFFMRRKKKSIRYVLIGLLLYICFFMGLIYFVISFIDWDTPVEGVWNCNEDITIELKENETFQLYNRVDESKLFVTGGYEYEIDSFANETKSTLELTANSRIVEGLKDNTKFKVLYDVSFKGDREDTMLLKNEKDASMLLCQRKE